jgi:agmatinase
MTFLRFAAGSPQDAADIAILGVPRSVSYPGSTDACADAPAAIRARSQHLARFVDHHDFDLDGPMLPVPLRIIDCGDVSGPEATEAAVRSLLAAGAVPLILGGDDSVPIPVLRAFSTPLTVVQVDAHLDFRDEVQGVREGYSSPMRRASEMAHVERIVQVGLRGVGSARLSDVADARSAGNLLVTARELRERGVAWLRGEVPAGASVFISFDLDGVDPSVVGAVGAPSPGGLSYDEGADLLTGLAARCRIAGAAFTELVPSRDVNDLSALVVVRLLTRLIAGIALAASD